MYGMYMYGMSCTEAYAVLALLWSSCHDNCLCVCCYYFHRPREYWNVAAAAAAAPAGDDQASGEEPDPSSSSSSNGRRQQQTPFAEYASDPGQPIVDPLAAAEAALRAPGAAYDCISIAESLIGLLASEQDNPDEDLVAMITDLLFDLLTLPEGVDKYMRRLLQQLTTR